jgi:hypothetical protein
MSPLLCCVYKKNAGQIHEKKIGHFSGVHIGQIGKKPRSLITSVGQQQTKGQLPVIIISRIASLNISSGAEMFLVFL